MKVEGVCNTCGRRFALVQLLPEPEGTGGRCPFCGSQFGRHYLSVLPSSIKDAEAGVDTLAAAIDRLQGMRPGFRVDVKALMRQFAEEVSTAEDESA